MSAKKRVSFHTLGCKLNFSETSTIARQFEEGGFERVAAGSSADICVVNTCSVTMNADKKGRHLIRQLIRRNPDAIIAVTGCYAQLKPKEIAEIEGVDIVISNNDKGDLFERVAELAGKSGGEIKIHSCEVEELTNFFASFSSGDRTRAFLKVQDGCNYRCTYCTIPNARGASRNLSIKEAVENAEQIAAAGQKEIVITGINTGDFGRSTGEDFLSLLRELEKVEGIERYRISSIEPNLLTDEIIEFTKNSLKFQPHFHIPLQSGSNRILALMKRRYTTEGFSERVEAVRRAMPDAFIGIDVIVGFPGEGDEDFDITFKLLEQLKPSFLHVFPYSERPDTPAIGFKDKVEAQIANERVFRLRQLSDKLSLDFFNKFVGKQALVLFESTNHEGEISGFTEHYIKVRVAYDKRLVNVIAQVTLNSLTDNREMNATIVGDR